MSSYFCFANLAALREFAQLWLDDFVPESVAAFLAARGISGPVNASVIVVGLKGSPADEWLIPYAAHLAGLSDARLQGAYVRAIYNPDRPPKAQLEEDRRLFGELGGTLREVRAGDPASGLIRAASKAGACQLVIGSRRRSRWSRLLTGSTVADQVLRAAGDLARPGRHRGRHVRHRPGHGQGRRPLRLPRSPSSPASRPASTGRWHSCRPAPAGGRPLL